MPILVAGDCSICLTTLPTVVRLVPEVRVLWLDAHGDFNTPDTTPSGFLGGMCLAGACGLWETGFEGVLDPRHVILVGRARPRRRARRPRSSRPACCAPTAAPRSPTPSTATTSSSTSTSTCSTRTGPALFPAAGGFSDDGLERMLDEVSQAAQRVVGLEITSCAPGHADVAARVVAPLLAG